MIPRTTFLIIAVLFLISLEMPFIDKARISPVLAGEGKETLWINGSLPESSETEGPWLWDKEKKQEDVIAHTSTAFEGIKGHSFRTDKGIELGRDSKIIQYVFLDSKNEPSGIMIRLFLTEEDPITVYWEGDEEAFVDTEEYITAWYIAPLPETGEWVKLEIDLKELDVTGGRLEGMDFISADGRSWWGKTIIAGE
jgi:hypothetical protein